jgi:hypothetical protein
MSSTINSDNGVSSGTAGLKSSADSSGVLDLQTNGTTAISISASQVVTYTNQPTYTGGTANGVLYLNGSKAVTSGSALVFDGTNLGVGTSSPTASKIHIKQTSNSQGIRLESNVNDSQFLFYNSNSEPEWRQVATYGSTGSFQPITWWTSDTKRMTLDTSGNLGLGVTPSAWAGGFTALQVKQGVFASNQFSAGNLQTFFGSNVYYDGSYRFITSGSASARYAQNENVHAWYQSTGTGTAGSAITFTQAMTLDASGNLGLGTTTINTRAQITVGDVMPAGSGNMNTGVVIQSGSFGQALNFGSSSTNDYSWINSAFSNNSGTARPLVFMTGATERARIDSSGRFMVNQTSASAANAGQKCQIATDFLTTGSLAGLFWENRSGGVTSSTNWYGWYTTSGTIYLFNGSANVASINPSSGAYTALSDVNKKKDFEDSNIGLSAVMQLKPKLFRMLDDAENTSKQLGFVAQDVKDIIPQAYVEQSVVDAGNNDATYIGLNDRPIIAALTKAIQEQQAIIESLTARLTALEGKS